MAPTAGEIILHVSAVYTLWSDEMPYMTCCCLMHSVSLLL